jgi:GNAT superfamily N-acetyltransferase
MAPNFDGGSHTPIFYKWTQPQAQTLLIQILSVFLPHSNPLYNRIIAPENTPFRHCLFLATFPPPLPCDSHTQMCENPFTIVFADLSRHAESQIWVFNPLCQFPSPSASDLTTVRTHALALLYFLRDVEIKEAPGWPFPKLLRFACVPTLFADAIAEVASPYAAVKHDTNWGHYHIPLDVPGGAESDQFAQSGELPEGYSFGRVVEDQIDGVVQTSGIPRQKESLLTLPNAAILDCEGNAVAWAFTDVDASFSTMYVKPEHRGKWLGTAVAAELLRRLRNLDFAALGLETDTQGSMKGEIEDQGVRRSCEEAEAPEWDAPAKLNSTPITRPFGMSTRWLQVEIKIGNVPSERVIHRMGGVRYGESRYIHVNTDNLPLKYEGLESECTC